MVALWSAWNFGEAHVSLDWVREKKGPITDVNAGLHIRKICPTDCETLSIQLPKTFPVPYCIDLLKYRTKFWWDKTPIIPVDCVELARVYPGMVGISLIEETCNIAGLENCGNLERVGIEILPKSENLNFSRLRNLKVLGFGQGYGLNQSLASVLEQCPKLQSLNLCSARFSDHDFESLRFCPDIMELRIIDGRFRNVQGLRHLKGLLSLWLHCRYVESFKGIETQADTLRFLTVGSCHKAREFDLLEKLRKLWYLEIEHYDSLPSVDFLMGMQELDFLRLCTRIEDGNTKRLLELPALSFAYFDNKKHNNMKWEAIEKALNARNSSKSDE
jgi:hypothetical protein